MGVHDLRASGKSDSQGDTLRCSGKDPRHPPNQGCSTDDCAYFWYPVKPVTGEICQLSGLSAWQLREDSRVFSEAEPEREGLAGVQLAEAFKGVAGMAKDSGTFKKGGGIHFSEHSRH